MGVGTARHPLVDRVNHAFHRDRIADTAARASHLGEHADVFDILHELKLFEFEPGVTLESYRANIGIPKLNQDALKLAFQASVRTKTPLRFGIVSGDSEMVQVTTRSDGKIYVLLTRKE